MATCLADAVVLFLADASKAWSHTSVVLYLSPEVMEKFLQVKLSLHAGPVPTPCMMTEVKLCHRLALILGEAKTADDIRK